MNKILKLFIFIFLLLSIFSCYVKLGKDIIINSSPIPSKSPTSIIPAIVSETLGQIEFRKILSGEKSSVRNYDIRVITNDSDFQKLWDDHTGSKTNPVFLPKVDFKTKNVVAIFLGDRPTNGFKAEIEKIEEQKDNITVFLKEVKPEVGSEVKAEITQPFIFLEIKKSTKRIEFDNSSVAKTIVENIPFLSLESGYDSGIRDFSKKVAKNEIDFTNLYKEHLSNQKNITTPVFPSIDFNKNMVIAIFLGERNGTSSSVEVSNVSKTESQITVTAKEVKLKTKNNGTTSPYQFITLPKSDIPIKFDINIIVPDSGNLTETLLESVNKTNELDIKRFASGESSGFKTSQFLLIKNKVDFQNLWYVHTVSNSSVVPQIEFENYDLIAVFMGEKQTSGFNIKVNSVIEASTEIRVFVDLLKDNSNVQNLSISPFDMVLVPKTNKTATFIVNNIVKN